jgi:UDP-N-acetylmuramoylalanine--D-glutamate ligase
LLAERVKAVLLFGASREIFEQAWQGAVPLSWDADLTQAMERARGLAAPGDVVLLSPATSSYDAFANYKERGDRFCRLVGAMASAAPSPKEAL